jgi:hypothetical protein
MEEAFRHGVVPAIALPAHALLDAIPLYPNNTQNLIPIAGQKRYVVTFSIRSASIQFAFAILVAKTETFFCRLT